MADKLLITTGMKCPRPLYEVHREIKSLEVGSVIEIRADDPAFKLDIEAWCKRTGHELLELQKNAECFVARIKKTK